MAPAAASDGMPHVPSETSHPVVTRSSRRIANMPSSSVMRDVGLGHAHRDRRRELGVEAGLALAHAGGDDLLVPRRRWAATCRTSSGRAGRRRGRSTRSRAWAFVTSWRSITSTVSTSTPGWRAASASVSHSGVMSSGGRRPLHRDVPLTGSCSAWFTCIGGAVADGVGGGGGGVGDHPPLPLHGIEGSTRLLWGYLQACREPCTARLDRRGGDRGAPWRGGEEDGDGFHAAFANAVRTRSQPPSTRIRAPSETAWTEDRPVAGPDGDRRGWCRAP